MISAWSVLYPHTVLIYLFFGYVLLSKSKKSPVKGSRDNLEDRKPKSPQSYTSKNSVASAGRRTRLCR